MSVLEEKIKRNKESFDVNEPPAGHFDRFHKKIGYSKPAVRRKMVFGIAWKVAAVGLLLFAISFLLPDANHNSGRELASQVMMPENYTEELQNLKTYYAYQKEKKLEEISELSCNSSDCAELKDFAQNEINQLENNTEELEEDFQESNNDSRLFHALVNNYQMMSNVLDQVIEKINNTNN